MIIISVGVIVFGICSKSIYNIITGSVLLAILVYINQSYIQDTYSIRDDILNQRSGLQSKYRNNRYNIFAERRPRQDID